MAPKGNAAADTRPALQEAPSRRASDRAHRPKKKISATERWLMISRNAYARAQRRGFVGGNPIEELLEAAREVDEQYATDVNGLLSLNDPLEIVKQFRDLFAGYGIGQSGIDQLLERNREAIEQLAESNRRLVNGAADRAARRARLLQNAAGEASKALHSLSRGLSGPEGLGKPADTPSNAVKDALSHLRAMASSAAEFASPLPAQEPEREPEQEGATEEPDDHPDMAVRRAVVKAYRGQSAAELADAPVAALRGISVEKARKLASALRINTIGEMASNRLAERAVGIVMLADDEVGDKSLADIADGPLHKLEGINKRQANLLQEAFRISSVRDLAENQFFRLARAIVLLADTT